jgi:hypothetical protein
MTYDDLQQEAEHSLAFHLARHGYRLRKKQTYNFAGDDAEAFCVASKMTHDDVAEFVSTLQQAGVSRFILTP